MKRILILTDFSDNAWNALFTALKLHEGTESLFYITNCFEPSFANVLGEKSKARLGVIYESLSKNSITKLDEVASYLDKHHQNPLHQFEKISIGDDIVEAVREFLKTHEVDLIVIGTRGNTGAGEVFMGSNAVKIIKKIKHYPILAVPAEQDFKALQRIVFPTDFTRAFAAEELYSLVVLAKSWDSEIIVFQVSQELNLDAEQMRNKTALERQFNGLNVSLQTGEMKINLNEAISLFVKNSQADMLALIHYSHTFLERLTREPVIKKMAFYTRVPLLVLPEKEY